MNVKNAEMMCSSWSAAGCFSLTNFSLVPCQMPHGEQSTAPQKRLIRIACPAVEEIWLWMSSRGKKSNSVAPSNMLELLYVIRFVQYIHLSNLRNLHSQDQAMTIEKVNLGCQCCQDPKTGKGMLQFGTEALASANRDWLDEMLLVFLGVYLKVYLYLTWPDLTLAHWSTRSTSFGSWWFQVRHVLKQFIWFLTSALSDPFCTDFRLEDVGHVYIYKYMS